ncbi:MAG: succinyldiaminopimelate transaminase [Gammaproteobacteria bacterium]|nr:succinyldiaminopimelate transaminase [Gammaproteobacteria bacterium]
MNPDITLLQAYPFERLAALKIGSTPPASLLHIGLSIGEPKHAAPAFVLDTLTQQLSTLSSYPTTKGIAELRQAITQWLLRRFSLPLSSIDPEKHILPVSGTREALFAFAQAVVDRRHHPYVVMPNPFYQIYEGAALLAGAQPYFLNTTAATGFIPDLDAVPGTVWQRCQLIYICSPGNPTGQVMSLTQLQRLMNLAEQYDFIIAADECYSEIYQDETKPPVGLLQAAHTLGNTHYRRCVVFHSLSKRSNLPGLRSGFVAGDAAILEQFHKYRTYHGCALPLPTQYASIAAWSDEQHVKANRDLYRRKFDAVHHELQHCLQVTLPTAGFYLWPRTPMPDEKFAQALFAAQNVTVLPGSYLSRPAHGENPGAGYVRMALVADHDQCLDAARRIRRFLE